MPGGDSTSSPTLAKISHATYLAGMDADLVWTVRMDSRRRPTLPPDLLSAAGISAGDRLTARVDEEGRIILESGAAALRRAKSLMAQGSVPESAVDEFLADRRAEAARELSASGGRRRAIPS